MLEKYTEVMNEIKDNINKIIASDYSDVNNILTSYFNQGGKGVRPILAVICSKLGNKNNITDVIHIASLIEIIHTTTLIHDDIIDKATKRRGNLTLNNIYGDRKSLFYGDYLFSKVLNEMTKVENIEIHNYLAKTLKKLCQGEIIQHRDLYNVSTTKLKYLKKIRNKTAILLAFSCVAGAIANDASKEDVKASYKFGYYLGMSYQIMDDYLDFTAKNKELGKDVGQDLLNGNITLPTILKIEKNDTLFENLQNKNIEEKKELIAQIKLDSSVLEETLALSNKYLKKALDSISNFDESVRYDLNYLVSKMYDRKY